MKCSRGRSAQKRQKTGIGEREIGSKITRVDEKEREQNKKGERENARSKESSRKREKRKSQKEG